MNGDSWDSKLSQHSSREPKVIKNSMWACDQSQALLTGGKTSLGTFRAMVDDLEATDEADRADRMPGKCCFDTPTTNDQYLGIAYSSSLLCEHPGPWHLGVSAEVRPY
jgi:hypothetical protein